jgi:putative phage-type endonuclease
MRKVEFEQGSNEWLAWRKKLLTATDAPGLMGASPYVTPYKLWQRKIGKAEEQAINPAMLRGQRDEPIARDWFNKEFGFDMQPCCIESEKYNYLGASLDGLSKCGKYILEIKSNGDQYHYGLYEGIPDFHIMQMQHQLLCTDGQAKQAFYLSINKGQMIVKEVFPDEKWVEMYLEKAKEFWRNIVFFNPPEMSNKDYKDMTDSDLWRDWASVYLKMCDKIKSMEIVKEEYRKQLIKMCEGESCSGHGIKVCKKSVKGRIDYAAILEQENVATILEQNKIDIEGYRKPTSDSWAITIDK